MTDWRKRLRVSILDIGFVSILGLTAVLVMSQNEILRSPLVVWQDEILRSFKVIRIGLTGSDDEKIYLLDMTLDSLRDEPVFVWCLWSMSNCTNQEISILTDGIHFCLCPNQRIRYDRMLAMVRDSQADEKVRATAMSVLMDIPDNYEESAKVLAGVVRSEQP
jgi:hypothetical protein